MIFRSKVDRWLLAVLALAALLPLFVAFASAQDGKPWLPHVVVAALLAAVFGWLTVTTRYVVGRGGLQVRSGPFTWTIALHDITRIAPSRSLLSSPALSLDRIRIDYAGGRKSLLVSPADKAGFVEAIESARLGG